MIIINENKFDNKKIAEVYDEIVCTVWKKKKEGSSYIVELLEGKFGSEEEDFKQNIKDYFINASQDRIIEMIKAMNVEKVELLNKKRSVIETFFELGANTEIKNIQKNIETKLKEKNGEIETYKPIIALLMMEIEECLGRNEKYKYIKNIKDTCIEKLKETPAFEIEVEMYYRNKELSKIISYDLMESRHRDKLLGAMGVEVCPYCNRQYITMWRDEGNEMSRSSADLDHYYPKALYPIASLCLHNFIPSCHICNSRMKLTKDPLNEEMIYPYKEQFGEDAKFSINSVAVLLGEEPDIKIERADKCANAEKIEKSIEVFQLESIYKSHNNYVKEMIEKVNVYTESQIEEYLQSYDNLFGSRDEIIEFVFGKNLKADDYENRPLSKLTHDILEDLGLKL